MKKLLVLALLVMFPLTNTFGQNSLTTIFDSNNGLSGPDAGFFFDIENVSIQSIAILSWEINCGDADDDGPSVTDISVYTRQGTSQGFEDTPIGWTLVGTQANVMCAGDNLQTPLSVGGFTINPGQTTGIAMVVASDLSTWLYTNGTGDNQIYNNGELELRTGSSYEFAFTPGGSVNEPRVWNGTVFYQFANPAQVPTLSEWGLISTAAILGIVGFMVMRRRKLAT
ncbi:MAG: hypothetical protein DHS20C13_26320 [Thermodesulfobacteriota bacterium]|nr:MAG: hypothetical protein DHS20C13_26320 [Thermodesulfobacteriota bacterium]